ncbi:uncharacterized protein LOC143291880 [Babylonia areolata]|uniref:uncharacterized protein LOC143291880 n=1 Tax=Babylonia areolata TaxID=304850 RepID=UPI003FD5CB45
MAFLQLYLLLLMVLSTAGQNFTNTTGPGEDQILAEMEEGETTEDSASSLGARRAACFRAGADTAAAAAAAVAAAGGDGGGANVTLHPFPSAPVYNLTCGTSTLVHHTLVELWAGQSSPGMCQHREAYEEISGCVLEATKSCLPVRNRVHYPDADRVKAGMRYICGVVQDDRFDVDMTCARAFSRQVLDCVRKDLQEITRGSSLPPALYPHLVCRTYEVADLCCWETLQACGKETAAAYTRLMALYFRPPSCPVSSASKWCADYTIALLVLYFIASRIDFGLIR